MEKDKNKIKLLSVKYILKEFMVNLSKPWFLKVQSEFVLEWLPSSDAIVGK